MKQMSLAVIETSPCPLEPKQRERRRVKTVHTVSNVGMRATYRVDAEHREPHRETDKDY